MRHYITVYGEQTEKLLRSYVDVESSGARDQIATARIETIEALQVLEQTAAGELSRAVSAKTLGITADSDAIQRLARMDGYDDVAPSPVPSSAADEGRHCAQSDSIWWPGSPVGPENGRTMKLSKSKIIGLICPACGSGRGLRHAGVAAIATSAGRTDRTGEHHRLPGRRENRPVR